MKILDLREDAVRPRILLIDFEKADAQVLRDCGYKVYTGSTGFKDGLFNIPIEPHRVDIIIYRVAYETKIPKPAEEIKLHSMTSYCGLEYEGNEGQDKPRKVWYTYPELSPTTECDFSLQSISSLRDKVLSKGGSILVFLGNTRIQEDETLMRVLLLQQERIISLEVKIEMCVYRSGGPEKEYEMSFSSLNPPLDEIGNYLKNLITGKMGHSVNFLRGFPYNDLRFSGQGPQVKEFLAHDENSVVYAYFKNRGERGNFMFLPDYGSANIDIAKHLLSILPSFSPKGLFSKNYQEGAWLEGEQFKFSDELNIIQQKDTIKMDFENRQKELEVERIKARANTDYFRAILTNGDDDKSGEDEQLKPSVKKVLEWLGIEVIDLDKILEDKNEALMNDFILKADDKEILCEVKGVTTGPGGKYVTQVHKHIIRFSKLTNQQALPGLLILNYQRDIDPNKRNEFYIDAAVIKDAEKDDIGLLDTRELFNITSVPL